MWAFRVILLSVVALSVKGVPVPDRTCSSSARCQQLPWRSPYPTCVDSECQCGNNSCLVYTKEESGYYFYCGQCGVLGSECNVTIPCDLHSCSEDNFCHCDKGDVRSEICVIYTPIPTTLTSVILIVVLVALLIILRLIKSWERITSFCRRRCSCFCSRRCSDTESDISTVVGLNPHSGEKSAAYTISNSNFMVTSHDSDLEWALEFSRLMQSQREDWLSMRSLTWSSNSSASSSLSRHLRLVRNRNPSQPARTTTLESITEPGPSGYNGSTQGQRTSISSRSSSAPRRRYQSQRSSTSSDVPSSISSGSSIPVMRTNSLMSSRGSRSTAASSTDSLSMVPSSSRALNPILRIPSTDTPSISSDTEIISSSSSRSSARSSLSLLSSSERSFTSTSSSLPSSPLSTSSSSSSSSTSSSSLSADLNSLSSKALAMVRFLEMSPQQRSNRPPVNSTTFQVNYACTPRSDSITSYETCDDSSSNGDSARSSVSEH